MSVNEVEKEAEVRRLVTRFASAAEPDYSRRNPSHDFRLQLLHVILDLAILWAKGPKWQRVERNPCLWPQARV